MSSLILQAGLKAASFTGSERLHLSKEQAGQNGSRSSEGQVRIEPGQICPKGPTFTGCISVRALEQVAPTTNSSTRCRFLPHFSLSTAGPDHFLMRKYIFPGHHHLRNHRTGAQLSTRSLRRHYTRPQMLNNSRR